MRKIIWEMIIDIIIKIIAFCVVILLVLFLKHDIKMDRKLAEMSERIDYVENRLDNFVLDYNNFVSEVQDGEK